MEHMNFGICEIGLLGLIQWEYFKIPEPQIMLASLIQSEKRLHISKA